MDDHVLLTCDHPLNLPTISPDEPLSPEALAALRSLIINPTTPGSTVSSVVETLTRSLQLSRDPLALCRTLKLLSDLASRHPRLSGIVFDSVHSHSLLSTESARVAAYSLDALASIAERDRALASGIEEMDDRIFASLCFGPSRSVRPWLLRNAERFGVQPHLLFTLFLGFTKDPYPYVRKAALDGLVDLSNNGVIEEHDMIEGCYFRAVELLNDMEDCVRSAAVRTVCAWGVMLIACCDSETKQYWSDEVFVKLCSMVRDMSMEVRVEVFYALGKIKLVSEDILLQTLSKKVLVAMKGKKSLAQCSDEQLEVSGSSVAGAFVHGLEDEFHEVRKAACHSLRTLTLLSAKFAGEALNLLMDVLNDDSILVRLQAFDTMHQMAIFDHLAVQETHMHMFLGTLVDNNNLVRSSAGKVLKLAKLPELKLFRLTIHALLKNLEIYPQDEADVLSVLFHIGRNHGKFVVRIIEEVYPQMEPMSNGKLGFDGARVAGLLALAISAPLSHERDCNIPPTIFSYAVTYLGRISRALSDIMNQNGLLDYLSQCSRSSGPYAIEFNFKEGEPISPLLNGAYTSNEIIDSVAMPFPLKRGGTSEILSPIIEEPGEVGTSLVKCQVEVHDEATKSMNVILAKVKDIWPLVQSGFTNEVLRTLRSCKEELATFTSGSLGSAGVYSFTKQYIQIMKLLTKAWVNFLPPSHFSCRGMGELDLVLGKLHTRLRDLQSSFIRLPKEEELHILELRLVTCILRLSKVEICCHVRTMRKLSSTMSQVELLLIDGSVEPSRFIIEAGKLSSEIGTSLSEASFDPLIFRRVLESFSPKQLVLYGGLKHTTAELDVPGNDYENPLRFVAGLPVGIPCHITLHNISTESRVWVKMTVNEDDESTQFGFLALNLFGGSDDLRIFTFTALFYNTPKAFSFTIRVCICMECLSEVEDVSFVKRWGPRHELTYLCREKDVYLCMVK